MSATTSPRPRSRKTDRRSVFWLALLLGACTTQPAPATGDVHLEERETPGAAPLGEPLPPVDGKGLDELAATARFCKAGPEAAVARGKQLLGGALVASAEVLPNPTLSAQHNRSLTGEEDHETVIGIGVPLGIGGRRWILQDAAAARRAQLDLEAAHGRVMAAVAFRRTFVAASLAQARLALLESRQEVYRELVAKLAKLEGGGEAASLDRDRLQVAAELSGAGAIREKQDLAARRAWLETVLDAGVVLTDDLDQLAAGGQGDAVGDNPKVAALKKSAEASAIEAGAARRRWVPDVTLFGGYRLAGAKDVDAGHGFSLGLSLPITFFDHGQGQAQLSEAKEAIARAELDKQLRYNRATERDVVARLAVVSEAMPRIKKALELAKKTERGTEKLYLADEAELLDVLQATRSRTELELAVIDLAAARADALLALMQVRGRFGHATLDAACLGGKR